MGKFQASGIEILSEIFFLDYGEFHLSEFCNRPT